MMFVSKFCTIFLVLEATFFTSNVCAFSKMVKLESVFRFANIYGDHMVLQMKPFSAVVWGFGEIGQTVDVKLGGEVQTTEVVKGPEGSGVWKVTLDSRGAGGPYNITATSKVDNVMKTITLEDVLFGDVWVCSGQSNMQFTVSQAINASEASKEADNYPEIRLFTASLIESETPLYELKEVEQPWSVASSETVNGGTWKYFSAVCWFYGKNLYDQFKRPLGLVATDWGGTPVEAWSSPDALRKCNVTGNKVDNLYLLPEDESFKGPQSHSVLYNAMIHPFLNMTIYGAIWYQGEANAGAPYNYNCTFPAMIDDWRSKWFYGTDDLTDPEFPFGFVQLSANGNDSTIADGFPVIRWAQTANYGYVPNLRETNVFMAVAMDLGNASSPYGSVHPNDKQDVGYRLALAGRAVAYGDLDVYYSGPIVSDVIITAPAKSNTTWIATVKYHHESVGLGGIELRSDHGFEFYCALPGQSEITQAKIVSSDFSSVHVTGDCPHEMSVQGIRYAWYTKPCDFKKCAVYSKENDLPGPPFTWNAPVN
ncbi:sialate O-acetylesterase-like [Pocillopora damicornis]|nr:sialate O-acetylesterase-like [Pocillopora damicornis]XP_058946617.1 sialate O-acetylesterase-like [Pocillopora verrucosa]